MQTKLTVRVEKRWIEAAKRYAGIHGTTLSRLISEFFQTLEARDLTLAATPVLRRLAGILPAEVSVGEHRRHQVEKYNA